MRKVVGMFIMILMCSSIPASVFASDNAKISSTEMAYSHEEFEELITFIITLQNESPNTSDEEIIAVVDRQFSTYRGISDIGDIWNVLTNEEKKLIIKYPFDALKVNSAKDIAIEMTNTKYGYNGLGDRSDAFRHTMWNAVMTIKIGEYKAELFATAHEETSLEGIESDGFSKIEHKNMDLHNNAIGRQIGKANEMATNETLANIIYNQIQQGNTNIIWLHD